MRLSDVPEDDQKGVPALNVTHAPMLRCCMRANPNRKRRNMAQPGKHGVPSTDGAKAAE